MSVKLTRSLAGGVVFALLLIVGVVAGVLLESLNALGLPGRVRVPPARLGRR